MLRTSSRILLGVLLALGGMELLFRALPVSTATMTGYHTDPDLITYPPGHQWQVATGWDLRNPQSLRSNNFGFVADIDFVPDRSALALIGDSYVEASMLNAVDRPGAQLQRLVPGRTVYPMGGPGSSLLDYAQRIRWAAQTLQVQDFVLVLERFDARQSLCGSGNVHSRCLDPNTLAPRIEQVPPPGLAKRVLRHSALAQYVSGQIRFSFKGLIGAMFSRTTPEKGIDSSRQSAAPTGAEREAMASRVDAVVQAFFESAAPYLSGKLIVVVDGRRSTTGEVIEPGLNELERAHLIRRLRDGGALVVDMEPVFAEHARKSAWALEVGPYDGHLNRSGVALLMQQAAAALMQ